MEEREKVHLCMHRYDIVVMRLRKATFAKAHEFKHFSMSALLGSETAKFRSSSSVNPGFCTTFSVLPVFRHLDILREC